MHERAAQAAALVRRTNEKAPAFVQQTNLRERTADGHAGKMKSAMDKLAEDLARQREPHNSLIPLREAQGSIDRGGVAMSSAPPVQPAVLDSAAMAPAAAMA
eukprot:5315933-Pyramimonas_sp.AAC.1